MDDDGEGVHRLARDQNVQLHHGRLPLARQLIVQRRIAAGDGLEAVVEVENDLVERQLVGQQHARARDVFEVQLLAALFLHQLENAADIFFIGENFRRDHRLANRFDVRGIRPARGIVHLHHAAVGQRDVITHAGRGGDQVQFVLALQPLLDDLHVQQAEKAAAEAKAQCDRAFRLEKERRVVEPQFLQRVAQQRVLMRVHGIQTGEDHRLDVFKAGQLRRGRPCVVGDGVADLCIADSLDSGGKKAHLAGEEFADLHRLGHQHAHGFNFKSLPVRHEANALSLAHRALHHAHQHDDAAIGVKPGVEDQRLQRRVGVARGRRQPMDNRFQHIVNALAGLGAHRDGVGRVQPHSLLDSLLGAHDIRRWKINLIDDRNDFQAVVDSQISVGQGLRLHALAGVHHQQRALARGQRPRNLVAEVHVPRRVDQVQLVGVAVVRLVHHAHGVRLDGDAALPLQIHIVQNLCLHLASRH